MARHGVLASCSTGKRLTIAAVAVGTVAPLVLLAGTANAAPDCDVPEPPPICDGPIPQPTSPGTTPTRADFDGDGKADLTVYRPWNNSWHTIASTTGQALPTVWFGPPQFQGNAAATGRFDGDIRADHGVLTRIGGVTPAYSMTKFFYRSSVAGTGAQLSGPDNTYTARPAIADYTGDGRDDMAAVDFGMTWSVPGFPDRVWGIQGDWEVPADYDKDKRADLAVWRPSNGTWYIIKSSTGTVTTRQWGQQGDQPVPGDYDRDGITDYAVWRPSNVTWYIIKSSTGAVTTQQWGQLYDRPVPLDYTGDRRTDVAVWRPSNGTWYVWPTGATSGYSSQWGVNGDVPIR